jgi:hypothetical protein
MASKNDTLIIHLASGKSYEAAAQLAGVDKSTVVRKMKNPAFRGKVRQARAQVLERALGHLSRGAVEAAVQLRNLLRSDDSKVRLGAANAILNAEHRFRESEDLAADIEDLKEQVRRLKAACRRQEKANGYPFPN